MPFSPSLRRRGPGHAGKDGSALDVLLLFLVVAAAVAQSWDLRFTTGDDLIHAVHHARGTMGAKTAAFATENGRLWLYLFMPMFGWVAALPNDLLYRSLTALAWVGAGTLPVLALRPLVGGPAVRLWLALFWGWLVLVPHAPPSAWPVMMCLPLAVLGGVGLAMARISRSRGGAVWVLAAAACFALALPHYESITLLVLLYTGLALVLALRAADDRRARRRLWLTALIAAGCVALYALAYLAYRHLHPPAYGGMQLAPTDWDRFGNVLWRFGGNGLGLLRWFVPRRFVSLDAANDRAAAWDDLLSRSDLLAVGLAGWLVAAAVAVVAIRALAGMQGRARQALPFLAFGIVVAIAAVGLQALAAQWQAWASDGFSTWLPTRFAWFGVVTAIAALVALSVTATPPGTPARAVAAVLAGLVVFAGALVSSAASAPIRVSMRVQTAKFEAFDRALSCAETRDMVWGRTLVGPHLFDWVDHATIASEPDWYDVWAKWKFGVPVHVVQKAGEAAGPAALLTHQIQLDGSLRVVAVRGTDGQALLLADRRARGYIRFVQDDGTAQQLPFDPRTLPRCGGDGFVRYALPAGTRIETLTLEALPR